MAAPPDLLAPLGADLALTPVRAAGSAAAAAGAAGAAGPDAFGGILARAAASITEPQRAAEQAVGAFAQGADGELHRTMLAVERADISLKFFVSMRNKALEAYREIMHMGS